MPDVMWPRSMLSKIGFTMVMISRELKYFDLVSQIPLDFQKPVLRETLDAGDEFDIRDIDCPAE
jgi:hypothetical protein